MTHRHAYRLIESSETVKKMGPIGHKIETESQARELAKLYRTSHSTFEEYCRERWGMRRAYADRMIRGASLVKEIDPIGSKITRESQARELAKVPAEKREAVIQKAAEVGVPCWRWRWWLSW